MNKPLPKSSSPSSLSLRGRAIKLLAQREHSRAELARKLVRAERRVSRHRHTDVDADRDAAEADSVATHAIEQVLDQLESIGLLSDARAAAAYVRGHEARFGTARLAHSLRTRGIDAALIEASLTQEEIEDEPTRAAAVWRSKFSQAPRDAREWARQARFLQGRGFSSEVIRRLLKESEALLHAAGDEND